jgi:hypothetical protein
MERQFERAQYTNIPAVYDPETNTASFFGPLPVATFDIKGVIKTAR